MNPVLFVEKMTQAWPQEKSKLMTKQQAEIIVEKLMRFADDQLDSIFNKLLETCKFIPKIADIYEAATDLEMLAKPATSGSKTHDWTRTDCRLCEGEGRLNVIMQTTYEATPTESIKHVNFVDIGPYSDARWIGYEWQEGFNSYIFRCSCEAGEVPTIPKAYPRWDPNRHQRATVEDRQLESKPVSVFQPMAKVIRMFQEEAPF